MKGGVFVSRKKAETGAFLTGKLSAKEFEALCSRRPTTQNNYAHITQADVIKAARQIGEKTKDSFSAWLNKGDTGK
jgi:hypothetical protein